MKGEQKARSPLELHGGERLGVERMIDQSLPEGFTPRGEVPSKRDRPSHSGNGGNGVVHPRHVEHRRDLANAIALAADEVCGRAVERQLGGWERASPEFVLEPVDADVAKRPVFISQPDEEDAEILLTL